MKRKIKVRVISKFINREGLGQRLAVISII